MHASFIFMRYWVLIAGAALGCGGNAKFSSEPPAATAGTSALLPRALGQPLSAGARQAGARQAGAFVPPMSFSSGSEIGFRIEPIGLAGASCVAPSSTNLTVTLENFAGELPICPTIRQFSVSEPRLFDASGDGRIEPGEDFTLSVTLTNPGPLDFNWYPGVMLSTDNPSVSGQYDDWRFAIAAGSSETHLARLHADASLPRGTTVMLTLHAAALNVACQNQPTLEYTILVE
jgi:hypothetical protein